MIPLVSYDDFTDKFPKDVRLPLYGQWELTCRCNLRCQMCYTDPFNTREHIRNELARGEILALLDEVVDAGCLSLAFTGGEAMARPDFLDIYDAAHRKGLLLTVLTNGTLITKKVADHFAAKPPRLVEISIHGKSGEVFDRVTGQKGSYQRCLQGVELLLERDIPMLLKTTAMTLNYEEILDIKKWVEDLGQKGNVQFRIGKDMRFRLDGSEDPKQFQLSREAWGKIEAKDSKIRQAASKSEQFLAENPRPCRSGIQTFHIDAYGRLQLCSGNRRMSYNLRKGSFKEGFYNALPAFLCPFKPIGDVKVQKIPPPLVGGGEGEG